MASCLPTERQSPRDVSRADFVAYRTWYGLVAPEHERNIGLGELGRFNALGGWIRLGNIFETSERKVLKEGGTAEGYVSILRSEGGGTVLSSEEMVFDPFISRMTGWQTIPREDMKEYAPLFSWRVLRFRIKFLRLRRADRNSLTYEYVKPSSALKVAPLRKNKWARALLLGGPLQREELRNPALLDWIRLNSKALRRQLDLLEPNERDEEYGLVVVLTRFTSVAFTDIKFLNQGDSLAPIIMGSAVGQNGTAKWLRGYPVEDARTAFNGEFICNEVPTV